MIYSALLRSGGSTVYVLNQACAVGNKKLEAGASPPREQHLPHLHVCKRLLIWVCMALSSLYNMYVVVQPICVGTICSHVVLGKEKCLFGRSVIHKIYFWPPSFPVYLKCIELPAFWANNSSRSELFLVAVLPRTSGESTSSCKGS